MLNWGVVARDDTRGNRKCRQATGAGCHCRGILQLWAGARGTLGAGCHCCKILELARADVRVPATSVEMVEVLRVLLGNPHDGIRAFGAADHEWQPIEHPGARLREDPDAQGDV